MMSSCVELSESKRKLDEALGDTKKAYFQLLKQWFQMKSSREEFYIESRKLLSGDQIRLHNDFLLNLFNTCQFPTSSGDVPSNANKSTSSMVPRERDKDKVRKSKSRKRTRSDWGMFEHADRLDYLQFLHPLPSQARDEPIRYCHQELFLPDVSHMRGRLLIGAWEHGMEGAGEREAEYLVMAVQYFLKNILTCVFSQRSSYRVREHRFQHSIGCGTQNLLLSNITKLKALENVDIWNVIEEDNEDTKSSKQKNKVDKIEREAIFEISLTKPRQVAKAPVSAFDLLEALQTDRKRIPISSHTVYSVNIARIIARLSHPTCEELEGGHSRKSISV